MRSKPSVKTLGYCQGTPRFTLQRKRHACPANAPLSAKGYRPGTLSSDVRLLNSSFLILTSLDPRGLPRHERIQIEAHRFQCEAHDKRVVDVPQHRHPVGDHIERRNEIK